MFIMLFEKREKKLATFKIVFQAKQKKRICEIWKPQRGRNFRVNCFDKTIGQECQQICFFKFNRVDVLKEFWLGLCSENLNGNLVESKCKECYFLFVQKKLKLWKEELENCSRTKWVKKSEKKVDTKKRSSRSYSFIQCLDVVDVVVVGWKLVSPIPRPLTLVFTWTRIATSISLDKSRTKLFRQSQTIILYNNANVVFVCERDRERKCVFVRVCV